MIYNTFRENSIGTAKPFLGSNLFYYIVIKRKVVHNLSNYNNAQLTIGFAYLSSTSSLSFNPLKREKTNFIHFISINYTNFKKAQRLTSKHQYVALKKGLHKKNEEIIILLIIYNIIGLDSSLFYYLS